jgi:hypothetical protein
MVLTVIPINFTVKKIKQYERSNRIHKSAKCSRKRKNPDGGRQLALDSGFAECYDVGGNDQIALMEQFAFFWINLAMMQGQGRKIGFKLLRR